MHIILIRKLACNPVDLLTRIVRNNEAVCRLLCCFKVSKQKDAQGAQLTSIKVVRFKQNPVNYRLKICHSSNRISKVHLFK